MNNLPISLSETIAQLQSERADYVLTKKSDIKRWLDNMEIAQYTIDKSGGVHVKESVELINRNLKFIPVNFVSVKGNFDISMNKLKYLEGAPSTVRGFYAYGNKLTTLAFSPAYVGGTFEVSENMWLSGLSCRNALNATPLFKPVKFYLKRLGILSNTSYNLRQS